MSVLINQTSAAPGLFLFGTSGGGGGGSVSTLNVSTINIQPNGEINWDGTINFQGTNGGYGILASTILGTATSATQWLLTGPEPTATVSTISMYVDAGGNAGILSGTPNHALNMNGASLTGVSSINGTPFPLPVPVAIPPNQTYTYVPAGGGITTVASLPAVTSGHWYRLEGTIRFQLDSNAAPRATDILGLTFSGNFNNFGNNNTVSCANISTLNNDVYQNISLVAKANNNNACSFSAYGLIGSAFSTSVGVEVPLVLTDLGAF